MLAAVNHGFEALPDRGSSNPPWPVRCRYSASHDLRHVSGCISSGALTRERQEHIMNEYWASPDA